jgi:hypothetical protein
MMPTSFRALAIFFALSLICRAADEAPPDPALASVVGKASLVLAKSGDVSLFYYLGDPTLVLDARKAEVSEPTGKLPSSGRHLLAEFVPNDAGIVVRFIGPQTRYPQSPWRNYLDTERRTFFFIFLLPGDQGIGVEGSYGSAFPLSRINELRAVVER